MSSSILPKTMRKIVVTQLTSNFREATTIKVVPVPQPGPGEILIKNRFVGINASDINFTAGRYNKSKPPFDVGFEAIGEVVGVGENASFPIGQAVMMMQLGAFSEYLLLPAKNVFPVPFVSAEFLPLMVSGLTASIALDQVGKIKQDNKVLVTAAAGGTGQFAVQWAKLAGCHVIGTCSSDEKVTLLKELGCDRPVNYKKEDLKHVLMTEYPDGVDVVYESVGGEMFNISVDSLAILGHLIIIGFISKYQEKSDFKFEPIPELPAKLLKKSGSISGFFMPHFQPLIKDYIEKQLNLFSEKKLRCIVDQGEHLLSGKFVGLERISDAIEYMYERNNRGKIVVELNALSHL